MDDRLDVLAVQVREQRGSLDHLVAQLHSQGEQSLDELAELTQQLQPLVAAAVARVGTLRRDLALVALAVTALATALTTTGGELAAAKLALVGAERVRVQIDNTHAALALCLAVLERFNRVLEMVRERRHFAALRELERLRAAHLGEMHDLLFARLLDAQVPAVTAMVREAATDLLERWIGSVARLLPGTGADLFAAMEVVCEEWAERQDEDPLLSGFPVGSPAEIAVRRAELHVDVLAPLDMSPVYDCVLVFETLDEEQALAAVYAESWAQRRDRILQDVTGENTPEFTPEALQNHLEAATALFAVDAAVTHKYVTALRLPRESRTDWTRYAGKLAPVLAAHVALLDGEDAFSATRMLLCGLLQVADDRGFDTLPLAQLPVNLFEAYTARLGAQCVAEFGSALDDDGGMPLSAGSAGDRCWYELPAGATHLPFLATYPLFCDLLRQHVQECVTFAQRLPPSAALFKTAVALVEHILAQVARLYSTKLVNTDARELVAQNMVNLEYFVHGAKQVAAMLADTALPGRARVLLAGVGLLQEARKLAEDKLFKSVDDKIGQFMELIGDYKWDTRVRQTGPSITISDSGRFLEDLFQQTFHNLPASVKPLLVFRAFHLLATRFYLLIQQAYRITPEAVHNLDLDVALLEHTAGEMDPGSDTPLVETFRPVRQLVELLKEGSLDGYHVPEIRRERFSKVSPDVAIAMVGRLVGEETAEEPLQRSNTMASTASKFSMMWKRGRESPGGGFRNFSGASANDD